MKKLFLLVIPFLLTGCIDDVVKAGIVVNKAQEERNTHPEQYITYFKDSNTGLCFASLNMPAITNVPCSPEVLKFIKSRESLNNAQNIQSNQSLRVAIENHL
jgi:hypothetical protein